MSPDATIPGPGLLAGSPAPESGTERIAVLGLGNVLMGDDAFGPWVVAHLKAVFDVPPAVFIEDLGTPGLDLTPYILDREALIVIDAISASGQPGEVRELRLADLLRHPPGVRLSPHDPGLVDALMTAGLAERGPREVVLVGAVVGEIAATPGLSAPVRAAVPAVADLVAAELARLGCPLVPRRAPVAPDVWWERP